MNKIIIFFVILLLSISSIIIFFQEEISAKLTENLNRNLAKDWGKDHQKYIKYNLKVDFLELSISWDIFNILPPIFPERHFINSIKKIDSSNCILEVFLALKIKLDVDCDELSIGYDVYEWELYQDLNISKSHFIIFGHDQNIFEDLYGKQGNHIVTINTNNLYINNTNQGEYRIKYYFQDKNTIRININKSSLTVKRQNEGLMIHTDDSDYFFLNSNFFKNNIKR